MKEYKQSRYYNSELKVCPPKAGILVVETTGKTEEITVSGISFTTYKLIYRAWTKGKPSAVKTFERRKELAAWMKTQLA